MTPLSRAFTAEPTPEGVWIIWVTFYTYSLYQGTKVYGKEQVGQVVDMIEGWELIKGYKERNGR